jgi:hypothetical protein
MYELRVIHGNEKVIKSYQIMSIFIQITIEL